MHPIFKPDPAALAFALALEALDLPRWWRGHLVSRLIPPPLHPVSLYYRLAAPLARPGGWLRGLAVAAACVLPAVAAAVAFRAVRGPDLAWSLAEGYLLKLHFSISHLAYGCALNGLSRQAVQEFVRRDLSRACPGHLHSACIEAAAESLVDSYISPLLWYAVGGLPAAVAQRAANTADGLAGFRHFGRAGTPAALLDTALNYLPARLAAALLLAWGVRDLEALRQRHAVESLNARWPIAAAAAALGVSLEKPGHYRLGRGPPPGPDAAYEGLRAVSAAAAVFGMAVLAALEAP